MAFKILRVRQLDSRVPGSNIDEEEESNQTHMLNMERVNQVSYEVRSSPNFEDLRTS